MSKAFLGGEIDWFAVDQTGAIALFATAGAGFVPDSVIEYRVMHETIANSIEYPNWGTPAVWDDVAALGIYVFDWKEPDGPYERVALPTNEVDAQIRLMVGRVARLPRYSGTFSSSAQIADVGDFDHDA